MQSTTIKNRNITFDLLKVTAIFTVLWGHCIQYFLSEPYYNNEVFRIIYSFHMPVFMAIVGFFSVKSTQKPLRILLTTKSSQLLIPGITIGIISYIIAIGSNKCEDISFSHFIKTILYNLWFLKSAFVCFFVFYISKINKRLMPYLICITLLLSQFVYRWQFNLMYPCFLLGVLLNKHYITIKSSKHKICIASGIIFLSMLIPWDERFWVLPDNSIYPFGSFEGMQSFIIPYCYRLALGLLSIIFFFTLFEIIANIKKINHLATVLSIYGRETLEIYVLQTIIIEMFLKEYFNFDNVNIWIYSLIIAPILSMIILYVCTVIIKVLKRSFVCSFLFFGKHTNYEFKLSSQN